MDLMTEITIFVLAAFVGAGLALGGLIVFYWDQITGIFSAVPLRL